MTTARSDACIVDFDTGTDANDCGATYWSDAAGTVPLGPSHFHSGTVPLHFAAPAGDSTIFLTAGPTDGSDVFIKLATPADYFGFLVGSLDLYNVLDFYRNGVLIDSFEGAQFNAVAFPGDRTIGDQAQAGYIDYFPGTFVDGSFIPATFDSIHYSSSANAFETDNHSFGLVRPAEVPEPDSLALLAAGVAAASVVLGLRARRMASA